MSSAVKVVDGLTLRKTLTYEEKLEDRGNYVTLIRDCIGYAIEKEASDIHFEPTNYGIKIRVRVGGRLECFFSSKEIKSSSMQTSVRDGVIKSIKWICNMKLGLQTKAQDGRIQLPERGIDIRVNKIPVNHGEKFVFRLFDKSKSVGLDQLGLDKKAVDDIREAISSRTGLIIITGATGSGKTTTIYSMIEEVDREELNVSTLEEPIERQVEGVNHSNITESLSFSEGLRALMRQDPDVVVLGEIRDSETAKLAIRLATTGHLVISTMHTDSALRVLQTFAYYGVDEWLVKECAVLVANQTLLREICKSCSIKKSVKSLDGEVRMANKKGCGSCNEGYSGKRRVIFEYYTKKEAEGESIELKKSKKREIEELIKKGVLDAKEAMA